ncbi:hypothetical protein GGR57DRAFT_521114 [Xylariaceae sp. FL1272]|nr:hypothetical protein GGR57DRAFT_521114 [Xylariaceae sp. FL1272]
MDFAHWENFCQLLWEAVRAQLQPEQPFIRITKVLYTELGIGGRQFFRGKLKSILGRETEFILDDGSPDLIYLANRGDLESQFGRAVHGGDRQMAVLREPSGPRADREPIMPTLTDAFSPTTSGSSNALSTTSATALSTISSAAHSTTSSAAHSTTGFTTPGQSVSPLG